MRLVWCFFFSPLSSDRVKEPCQPLFFSALAKIPMGWLWIKFDSFVCMEERSGLRQAIFNRMNLRIIIITSGYKREAQASLAISVRQGFNEGSQPRKYFGAQLSALHDSQSQSTIRPDPLIIWLPRVDWRVCGLFAHSQVNLMIRFHFFRLMCEKKTKQTER
jgi:hypothetical protein